MGARSVVLLQRVSILERQGNVTVNDSNHNLSWDLKPSNAPVTVALFSCTTRDLDGNSPIPCRQLPL